MTVIQTYEEYLLIVPGLILLFIGAILFTGFAVSLYYESDKNENFKIFCITIGLLLVLSGSFMAMFSYTYHQIFIDENTSISEVQAQYEIVEQKGISYIVKDIAKE